MAGSVDIKIGGADLPLPNSCRPYCSQGLKHLMPIRTIVQGESLIQEIFQRTPLCWHAVDSINRIYQQVVHIEQEGAEESISTSVTILELIFSKTVDVAQKVFRGQHDVSDVISYYYLQNYLAQELRVANLNHPWPRLENALRHAIAAEIPCCGNVEQFENDVEGLLGKEYDSIIERQIERIEQTAAAEQQRLAKILDIADCKKELSVLRQQGMRYPPDFDKLVELGYTNLYRYLSEMRTIESHEAKKNKIFRMNFAQVSQVICETYEALMQPLELEILNTTATEIILLVGDTGAGKTTAYCAITGKALELRNDRSYDVVNDADNMIGHDCTSCTFFPRVQRVEESLIVDFPGLRDTNGWPISLVIELVLLTLANKYQAKILVLESITNDAGRYQGVAELAARLERLFSIKENLMLGITKYSQNVDFARKQEMKSSRETHLPTYKALMNETKEQIQELEEGIRKAKKKLNEIEKTQVPSENIESQQEQRKKWEAKLQNLQDKLQKKTTSMQENAQKLELFSRESPQELECQQRIEEKETMLRKQIGIDSFISFSNLESQEAVEAIRTQLFQWQAPDQSPPPVLKLDPSIKESIIELFRKQLIPSLEFHKRKFKDIHSFEASVLNSSLTATVAPPEVGQFLHLSGIPSALVAQFDQEILDVCIKGQMKVVFSTPLFNYIRQLVLNLRQQNAITIEETTKQLMDKWQTLETYIVNLLGESPQETLEAANRQWQMLKERYTIIPEEPPHLPFFLRFFLPSRMYLWLENRKKNQVEAGSYEQNLQAHEPVIVDIERTLLGLHQLKLFLNKKDEINQYLCHKAPFSALTENLLETIKTIIAQVRHICGVEDWDRGVKFLTTVFYGSDFFKCLNHSLDNCLLLLKVFITIVFFDLSSIKNDGKPGIFSILKTPALYYVDAPPLSVEQSIFKTWSISIKSLTPFTSLQLIDCILKSGIHPSVFLV